MLIYYLFTFNRIGDDELIPRMLKLLFIRPFDVPANSDFGI